MIKVTVRFTNVDARRVVATVSLPDWCSPEPLTTAAIYLFGYRSSVDELNIILLDVEEA